jgi:hypothetical protein
VTCLLEREQEIGKDHGEICLSPFLRSSNDSTFETSTRSTFIERNEDLSKQEEAD